MESLILWPELWHLDQGQVLSLALLFGIIWTVLRLTMPGEEKVLTDWLHSSERGGA